MGPPSGSGGAGRARTQRWVSIPCHQLVLSMTSAPPSPVSPASSAAAADGAPIALPKTSESPRLQRIRHSMSHVLAMAVQKLFPRAQVTIGPWTETGFYYDFDNPEPFTEADLKAIQKEMGRIIGRRLPLVRIEVSREEAERRIRAQNEPYKLEILEGLSEPITLYTLGEHWWDLCAGPHVEHTGELNPKAFALESVAGAYWRGDENRAQLQRIYGTAWETPEQLAEYRRRKEEALRRDHRRLGTDLDLFSIEEEAGAGPGVLASPRRPHASADRGFLAPGPLRRRLRAALHPPRGGPQPLEDLGPPRLLQREHVRPDGGGRAAVPAQADELPVPRAHLRQPAALLPGTADPLGGAGHGLPLRAARGDARADAGARLHPGRRPRLLPAGADLR